MPLTVCYNPPVMTASTTTPSHNISAADLEKMVTDIVTRVLAAQGGPFAPKADNTRLEGKVEAEASRLESKANADNARLQGKIDRLEGETKAENTRLESKIDAGFARLEGRMEAEFARLESKIDAQANDIKMLKNDIKMLKSMMIGLYVGLGVFLAIQLVLTNLAA